MKQSNNVKKLEAQLRELKAKKQKNISSNKEKQLNVSISKLESYIGNLKEEEKYY